MNNSDMDYLAFANKLAKRLVERTFILDANENIVRIEDIS